MSFKNLGNFRKQVLIEKKKTIAKILNNILCVHPVKMLGYNILKSVAFYMNLKKPT